MLSSFLYALGGAGFMGVVVVFVICLHDYEEWEDKPIAPWQTKAIVAIGCTFFCVLMLCLGDHFAQGQG